MAKQVDFYVLDQRDADTRLLFVCRLLGKIVSLQQRACVLVDDQATAAELDEKLWSSPPESFIPHGLEDEANNGDALEPVTIRVADCGNADQVCINLRQRAPDNHAALTRVVEVVCQDTDVLDSTREKYRFYRQLGYPLQSHSISANSL